MKLNSLCVIVVALIACLQGCGPAAPKTVPAAGILMMDGKPLEGASINMVNDQGIVALATTDAGGKFAFKTHIGSASYDGAVPGSYKVGVSKATNNGQADSDGGSNPAASGDPKQMASRMGGMATSNVKVTYIVPQRYSSPTSSGLTLDVPAAGSDALKLEVKSK